MTMNEVLDPNWNADTSAIPHMTADLGNWLPIFLILIKINIIGNGTGFKFSHTRKTTFSSSPPEIALQNVLVVAQLESFIISQLTKNYTYIF